MNKLKAFFKDHQKSQDAVDYENHPVQNRDKNPYKGFRLFRGGRQ